MNDFHRRARLIVAIGSAALAVACEKALTRATAETGGTVVIATTSDPDALFPPFSLNMEARQATELIYEYLADVGPGMNTIGDGGFVGELAAKWRWATDSSSIAFTIDPRARWHDGARVTAHDVAFSFSIYTDSAVSSSSLGSLADIDSVSAPDSVTAVFWFKRRTPLAFYNAASQMLILPAHILEPVPRDSLRAFTVSHVPVGSGRYRLASWKKGSSFELRAVDNHYRGRPGPERLIWSVTPEYQSAVTSLLSGAADVFPNMRQESIDQLKSGGKFNLISLPGMDYVFLELNLRSEAGTSPNSFFASRDARRALTMALDRRAMVRNLFDTLANVSIGPTVRAYPTTDTSVAQIPYDPVRAEHLLDSLGWRNDGAGAVRKKAGQPFSFSMLVPVSSLSRMRIAVLIQEQLRKVGIEAKIEQMDYSAFSDRQASRKFDAALASWHLGSDPTSLRDTWTSTAAAKGGLNYGSYRNPVFDRLVDSALSARSVAQSSAYLKSANQIIVDDAPAVWLYEPRTVIAVASRIRTTPMRPSAWWVDIASWRIPPGKRIARDALVPAR
jgi:peptide/nickel transport system substrate-binding protein